MDELVGYLKSQTSGRIVTGDETASLLLLGEATDTSAVPRVLLLTVGIDCEIGVDAMDCLRHKYKSDPVFKRLFDTGNELSRKASLGYILVGYHKCPPGKIDGDYIGNMRFLCEVINIYGKECSGKEERIFVGEEFCRFLYEFMDVEYKDHGAVKQVNKHISDAFHAWSRAMLSGRIVKQDFYAIFMSRNGYVIIEIKRAPSGTVEGWQPYIEDVFNYHIEKRFSEKISAPFFTLHHRGGKCDGDTDVGCYLITDVSIVKNKREIKYEKAAVKAKDLIGIFEKAALDS